MGHGIGHDVNAHGVGFFLRHTSPPPHTCDRPCVPAQSAVARGPGVCACGAAGFVLEAEVYD